MELKVALALLVVIFWAENVYVRFDRQSRTIPTSLKHYHVASTFKRKKTKGRNMISISTKKLLVLTIHNKISEILHNKFLY